MLLPYFTNGCIDSMEGLLFESASTTPFHFINQNELSPDSVGRRGRPPLRRPQRPPRASSTSRRWGSGTCWPPRPPCSRRRPPTRPPPWSARPDRGAPATTARHSTPPGRSTGSPTRSWWCPWPTGRWCGRASMPTSRSWLAPAVAGTTPVPVERGAGGRRSGVVDAGPGRGHRTVAAVPSRPPPCPTSARPTRAISFHVDRVGTPVEVRVSYFPNWQATGAEGPWRVAPNLMVVVPTSHDVTLHLRQVPADYLGQADHRLLSLVAVRGPGRGWRRRAGGRGGADGPPVRPGEGVTVRPLGMFPLSTVLFPEAGPAPARVRGALPGPDGPLPRGRRRVRRGPDHPGLRGRRRRRAGRRRHGGPDRQRGRTRRRPDAGGGHRRPPGPGRPSGWPTTPIRWPLVEDLPDRAGPCPGEVLTSGRGVAPPAAVAAVRAGRRARTAPQPPDLRGPRRRSAGSCATWPPWSPIDLQRLLAADGLEARMGLLADLCDAMSGDVLGLLSEARWDRRARELAGSPDGSRSDPSRSASGDLALDQEGGDAVGQTLGRLLAPRRRPRSGRRRSGSACWRTR